MSKLLIRVGKVPIILFSLTRLRVGQEVTCEGKCVLDLGATLGTISIEIILLLKAIQRL
jgi:hypothetical protein